MPLQTRETVLARLRAQLQRCAAALQEGIDILAELDARAEAGDMHAEEMAAETRIHIDNSEGPIDDLVETYRRVQEMEPGTLIDTTNDLIFGRD